MRARTRFLRMAAIGLFAAMAIATLEGVPSALAAGNAESEAHLRQARDYYANKDLRAAQIELQNAVKADPNNIEARLLLAEVYLGMGQGIAAQTEIEAARQRGADRDSTAVDMARSLLIQRNYHEAMDELDAVEIPESDQMQGHLVRGDLHHALDDQEAAFESYLAAEEAAPNDYKPKMALSRQAMRLGNLELADQKADEAIALAPGESSVHLTKGLVARAKHDQEAAVGYFTAALDLQPQNLAARLERAATLLDLQREEEAQADIDAVYQAAPEHPLAHYLSAVILARQQDYNAAKGKLEDTGNALDSFLPAVLLKGIVSYYTGNLEQASLLLSRVVNEQPENITARRAYGSTLLRLRDARAAVAVLEPLLELGDDDAQVYALIGSAYMQMGDVEKAQGFLEEAVTRAPDANGVRTQLAIGHFALGEKENAISELENILEEDPSQLRAAIMLSLIEQREGNFQEALGWADKVVGILPNSPIGYNMRGSVRVALKDLDEAQKDFEKALDIEDDFQLARGNLAQLERLRGNKKEARRLFQYILNQERDNTRALVSLTEMAMQDENPEEAIDWANRAVTVAPAVARYRLMLMQAQLAAGQKDNALQTALDADQAFPNEPDVAQALGKVHYQRGEFTEAANSFSRWARMSPDNVDARHNLARAEWKAGQIEEARLTFSRALGMAGSSNRRLLADAATFEAEQHNYEQALAYARELQKAHPDASISSVTLGMLYLRAGRPADAVTSYREAMANEDNERVRIGLSDALLANNQGDEAIGVLQGWLKDHPDSREVLLETSYKLIRLKRWKEAADHLERLVATGEPDASYLNNLANVYQIVGDPRAVDTAQQAYDLAPQNPSIADTLGWVLVESKTDARRGLLLLQDAAEGAPENPTILYHLGVALKENGRAAEARKALEQALSLKKSFDDEAEARTLLQGLSGG